VPPLRLNKVVAIERLARGLSVRDIEDAFKDETGRLLLSKTAVSQLGERLWEDYRAFTHRDLSALPRAIPADASAGYPDDEVA
jgi:transposase-like protein